MRREQAEARTPARAGPALAWLALAAVQVAIAFASDSASAPGEAIYGYALFLSALLTYGLVAALSLALAGSVGSPRHVLGLVRPAGRWLLWTIVVAVFGLAVSAALEPLLDAGEAQGLVPEEWRPDRALPFALNLLVIVTLGPFVEELFYRGLGQRALEPFLGAAAVAAPAIAWSFAHGLVAAVPPLLVFGVALGWLRRSTGSLWPPVAAHAIYNAVAVGVALA